MSNLVKDESVSAETSIATALRTELDPVDTDLNGTAELNPARQD